MQATNIPRWFILLLLLLAIPGGKLLAVEIVFPADKTVSINSNYLIIKAGERPQVDALVIGLNGAETDPIDISGEEYRQVFADMLILQPEFDPGVNTITAQAYFAGKKVDEVRAEIYFQSDPTMAVPEGFSPFVMHTPENEAICAPCHNMDPSMDEFESTSSVRNPCMECHKYMLDRAFVHGPAGVSRCSFCHDRNSEPRYAVTVDSAELCGECHQDKIERFNQAKYVHGPVAAGLCTVCHDPHSSNFKAQLYRPVNDVCSSCHDQIKKSIHVGRGVSGKAHPLKGVPNPLANGGELSCASCHDPHSGNGPQLFTQGVTSRYGLCQLCHKK